MEHSKANNDAFYLGRWRIEPDLNQLVDGEKIQRLEPRAMQALLLLAEANGRVVTRRELFDRIWPNQTIADQTLSSLISQLRRHLEKSAKTPELIGTVPKKGYRLLQPVRPISSPITEHPEQHEIPAPISSRLSTLTSVAAKRPIWQPLVLLLLLVTVGTWIWHKPTPTPTIPTEVVKPLLAPSIAVLPFANMSTDADGEYFSDGIAEELLNRLANIQGLRVVSRTSSFQFREDPDGAPNLDIRSIAKQLDARYVIEGSVRREGARVRITVQLIEGRSGYHRWSQTYDRQWDQLFALQDEITQAVVGQVSPRLLSDQLSTKADSTTAAYDRYLQGLHLRHQRTPASLREANRLFEEAIAIDPDYALAFTGLADSVLLQYFYGGLSAGEVVTKAGPLLDRALALSPELPEAHLALGNLLIIQTDWEKAEASLNQALSLNENLAMAHMSQGNVFNQSGRLDQAYQSYRRAGLLSPLHATIAMNMAQAATKLGMFEPAIAHLQVAQSVAPDHPYMFGLASHVYIAAGDHQAMQVTMDQWLAKQNSVGQTITVKEHHDYIACGRVGVFLNQPHIARACLEPAVSDARQSPVPQYQMEALTQLALIELNDGNVERAERLVSAAIAQGKAGMQSMPAAEFIAYELGVAYALANNVPAALSELHRSVELGRRDLGWVLNDRRLSRLVPNPDFADFIVQLTDKQAALRNNLGQPVARPISSR